MRVHGQLVVLTKPLLPELISCKLYGGEDNYQSEEKIFTEDISCYIF